MLFQAVTLFCTATAIIVLFSTQIRRECSLDQSPAITRITPASSKKFSMVTTPVQVGFTINDFAEFNVEENKFMCSGIVWFAFDPSLISLDTVGKFSFLKGTLEYKSSPTTRLEGQRLIAEYEVRISFKTNLYYGRFPLDDHTLYLVLVNREVNPNEVIFQAQENDFIITDALYVSGWTFSDKDVVPGYGTVLLGSGESKRERKYPQVLFSMHFFHESMRYLLSILLPLFIVFFIDLFSFCLDQRIDHNVLVSVSTGNIIALIAYRFIIEAMAPKVGYLLLSDYAFFLFLFNTLTVFVINCMGPYLSLAQKKVISITLQSLLISSFLFLFWIWLPC